MSEYKIEDFSGPITAVKGVCIDADLTIPCWTGVFWDIVDFPFPVGWDPDMVYHKIESALSQVVSLGHMSIWVYVDEQKGDWQSLLTKNTWNSRIFFLSGGDKLSRRNRMLNDILFWEMDYDLDARCQANLIIFSDKVRDDEKFFNTLASLNRRHYSVLFVTPTDLPEKSAWPLSLLRQCVYCFDCERLRKNKEEECCLEMHKVDAAKEPPRGSEDQASCSL